MAAKKKAESKAEPDQEETSPASEGPGQGALWGPSQDDLNPAYAPKDDEQ